MAVYSDLNSHNNTGVHLVQQKECQHTSIDVGSTRCVRTSTLLVGHAHKSNTDLVVRI